MSKIDNYQFDFENIIIKINTVINKIQCDCFCRNSRFDDIVNNLNSITNICSKDIPASLNKVRSILEIILKQVCLFYKDEIHVNNIKHQFRDLFIECAKDNRFDFILPSAAYKYKIDYLGNIGNYCSHDNDYSYIGLSDFFYCINLLCDIIEWFISFQNPSIRQKNKSNYYENNYHKYLKKTGKTCNEFNSLISCFYRYWDINDIITKNKIFSEPFVGEKPTLKGNIEPLKFISNVLNIYRQKNLHLIDQTFKSRIDTINNFLNSSIKFGDSIENLINTNDLLDLLSFFYCHFFSSSTINLKFFYNQISAADSLLSSLKDHIISNNINKVNVSINDLELINAGNSLIIYLLNAPQYLTAKIFDAIQNVINKYGDTSIASNFIFIFLVPDGYSLQNLNKIFDYSKNKLFEKFNINLNESQFFPLKRSSTSNFDDTSLNELLTDLTCFFKTKSKDEDHFNKSIKKFFINIRSNLLKEKELKYKIIESNSQEMERDLNKLF